jgi:hypothetical protein
LGIFQVTQSLFVGQENGNGDTTLARIQPKNESYPEEEKRRPFL